jgi:hypothetical protein
LRYNSLSRCLNSCNCVSPAYSAPHTTHDTFPHTWVNICLLAASIVCLARLHVTAYVRQLLKMTPMKDTLG